MNPTEWIGRQKGGGKANEAFYMLSCTLDSLGDTIGGLLLAAGDRDPEADSHGPGGPTLKTARLRLPCQPGGETQRHYI